MHSFFIRNVILLAIWMSIKQKSILRIIEICFWNPVNWSIVQNSPSSSFPWKLSLRCCLRKCEREWKKWDISTYANLALWKFYVNHWAPPTSVVFPPCILSAFGTRIEEERSWSLLWMRRCGQLGKLPLYFFPALTLWWNPGCLL